MRKNTLNRATDGLYKNQLQIQKFTIRPCISCSETDCFCPTGIQNILIDAFGSDHLILSLSTNALIRTLATMPIGGRFKQYPVGTSALTISYGNSKEDYTLRRLNELCYGCYCQVQKFGQDSFF